MTHTEPPPRFLINPMAMQHSIWFPRLWQLAIGAWPNPNYLNSVWLGVVYNALTIPFRVLDETVLSLVKFDFGKALLSLFVIPASFLLFVALGLRGRLTAVSITQEQAVTGMVLDREQCEMALRSGSRDVVIDLTTLSA